MFFVSKGILFDVYYRIHKRRKTFSKYYRQHFDLVSKFTVGIKSLLQQGLLETKFNGDLVYEFRRIYVCNDFRTQFRKISLRYIKAGYNINVIQQTIYKVVNPIIVNNKSKKKMALETKNTENGRLGLIGSLHMQHCSFRGCIRPLAPA